MRLSGPWTQGNHPAADQVLALFLYVLERSAALPESLPTLAPSAIRCDTGSGASCASERRRVTKRWPSDIRSTSMAIASIPCSSRSRRRESSGEPAGLAGTRARFHINRAAESAMGARTKRTKRIGAAEESIRPKSREDCVLATSALGAIVSCLPVSAMSASSCIIRLSSTPILASIPARSAPSLSSRLRERRPRREAADSSWFDSSARFARKACTSAAVLGTPVRSPTPGTDTVTVGVGAVCGVCTTTGAV